VVAAVIRLGLVGAGSVAQAIHIPTVARLGGDVCVTEVMDVDPELARVVAGPHGARATSTLEEMLAGDGIDVAVIGSPNAFHLAQIEAVCAAGVSGIMVEKPVVLTRAEAQRMAAAVTAAGVALVVGAMHTYDPAWLAAREALEGFGPLADQGPFHVRSAVHIPGNERFEDMATTMTRPVREARPAPSAQAQLRGGVMGLAIHDLPLVRTVLPRIDEVVSAKRLEPWGYVITATGAGGTLELLARTGGTWRPDWAVDIWGRDLELSLDFPPSYVHAGSGSARLRGPDGRDHVFGPYPTNGYVGEWRELLAVLGGQPPRYDVQYLVDDVAYAIDLADHAVAALEDETAGAAR